MKNIAPPHYQGASAVGFPYLELLGIQYALDKDLFAAINTEYPDLAHDYHRATAAAYFWRLGNKGPIAQDLAKAAHHLREWLQFPAHHDHPEQYRVCNCLKRIEDTLEDLTRAS